MATLEAAGFLYNPFTTQDIFGHPTASGLMPVHNQQLLVGHDTSSLPQLASQPELAFNTTQGSGKPEMHKQTRTEFIRGQNSMTTAVFAVLLVAAVLWTRSGSQ